jgi:hypothetical protein
MQYSHECVVVGVRIDCIEPNSVDAELLQKRNVALPNAAMFFSEKVERVAVQGSCIRTWIIVNTSNDKLGSSPGIKKLVALDHDGS